MVFQLYTIEDKIRRAERFVANKFGLSEERIRSEIYLVAYLRRKGILGLFNLYSEKIYLDADLLHDASLFLLVLTHELVHKAQKSSGRIFDFSRSYLEEQAYRVEKEFRYLLS